MNPKWMAEPSEGEPVDAEHAMKYLVYPPVEKPDDLDGLMLLDAEWQTAHPEVRVFFRPYVRGEMMVEGEESVPTLGAFVPIIQVVCIEPGVRSRRVLYAHDGAGN